MNRYVRHGTATIEEIVALILEHWNKPQNPAKYEGAPNDLGERVLLHEKYPVGVTSTRMRTFGRAYKNAGTLQCVSCGLKASFFSVDTFANGNQTTPHLNLFGVNKDGHDVLFTHDHVLARGLGGVDNLSNTQVMCSPCNNRKSRKEGKLAMERRKKESENESAS